MHSASPRDEQEKYLRLTQYTPKLDNLLKKLFYDTLITYVLICAYRVHDYRVSARTLPLRYSEAGIDADDCAYPTEND